jgi:hypothetical protein
LVGVGERGRERPVLVVQPRSASWPANDAARETLAAAIRSVGARHELGAASSCFPRARARATSR